MAPGIKTLRLIRDKLRLSRPPIASPFFSNTSSGIKISQIFSEKSLIQLLQKTEFGALSSYLHLLSNSFGHIILLFPKIPWVQTVYENRSLYGQT